MRRLRTRASARSPNFETFSPESQYSPLDGRSKQPMMFISVDLPEPEGPMTATYSFSRISQSTPFKAWMVSAPMR